MAPLGTPLARFVALYALMYAAFGVSSPFMPVFFASRGVTSGQLGLLLAADTAIRLVSGPLAGRLADLTGAVRAVLAFCTGLAALVALLSAGAVPLSAGLRSDRLSLGRSASTIC